MIKIYETNGLPFWDANQLAVRRYLQTHFARGIENILRNENGGFRFYEIEGPCLVPIDLVNPEYTDENIFKTADDLALRPETTMASYAYAQHILGHDLARPPLVIHQAVKSFRREQDQVTKNVRLKEFTQQEFQCIFTEGTKNDYMAVVLDQIADLFYQEIGLPTRIVESDRLPHYSTKTMDVEVQNTDKWMELCSISNRIDVPFTWKEKNLLNVEIAIGLDRCVYNKMGLYERFE